MKFPRRYSPDLYQRLVDWADPRHDDAAARQAREQAEAEQRCKNRTLGAQSIGRW